MRTVYLTILVPTPGKYLAILFRKKKKKGRVRAHVSEITNKLALIDNAWIQLQTIAYTSFIAASSWKSISDKGFLHFR